MKIYFNKKRSSRGFTLIEMLVVISIIGLLSAIILAALNSARLKGQEAVIIGELVQFRDLYELAYSTNGNYGSLQPQSVSLFCPYYNGSNAGYVCTASAATPCSNIYGVGKSINDPNYYPTALNLCNEIVASTGSFSIGLAISINQQYSLWAYLPSQNKYMCLGSSKNNSIVSSAPIFGSGSSGSPGCPGNP
jgi:prepilin-type N-terminal cleavage/methylation domain-containing protein